MTVLGPVARPSPEARSCRGVEERPGREVADLVLRDAPAAFLFGA